MSSEMERFQGLVKELRNEVVFNGQNFRADSILIEFTKGEMRTMHERLESIRASLGQLSTELSNMQTELLRGRFGAGMAERTATHAERAGQLSTMANTLFSDSSSNNLRNASASLRSATSEAEESAAISSRLQEGLEKAGGILGVSKVALTKVMDALGTAHEIAAIAVDMTNQANDKSTSASSHGQAAITEINHYITSTGGAVDMP